MSFVHNTLHEGNSNSIFIHNFSMIETEIVTHKGMSKVQHVIGDNLD